MVRALSNAKKQQDASVKNDIAKLNARDAYLAEHEKPPGEPRQNLRDIAEEYDISHVTLSRLVKGGRTIREFNSSKQLLTVAEEDVIARYASGMADRGFPLTHRMLEEKARMMLVRKGINEGPGETWITRFLVRHKELRTYRLTPLDQCCANGLNPTAVKLYWDTVQKEVIDVPETIPPENLYAADETGIQGGLACSQIVIGGAGKRNQHLQQDGNRENTTVIETICADGTSLKPTVIFKAKQRRLAWGRVNPDDANICYSDKGYTDNELGIEWMMNFHEQTKDKNDLTRVIWVDGHASHCTAALLDFAVAHNIIVISYPPHTTHALQGLDVACFGPLKVYWSEALVERQRKRLGGVGKDQFLEVYSDVRALALTVENIKAAFRATGIFPFNRDIITEVQMAPSREASTTGGFPLALPTPARKFMAARRRDLAEAGSALPSGSLVAGQRDSSSTVPPSQAPSAAAQSTDFTPTKRVESVMDLLKDTSASFLTSESPLRSTSRLPPAVLESVPQTLLPDYSILDQCGPASRHGSPRGRVSLLKAEVTELRAALRKAQVVSRVEWSINEGAQAQLVLRDLHLDELTSRLEGEESKSRKTNSRAALMASADARFMTGEIFRTKKRAQEEATQAKVDKRAAYRKEQEVTRRRKAWKAEDKVEHDAKIREALAAWEIEKERCKRLKLKAPPKPKVRKDFPRTPTPEHLKASKKVLEPVDNDEEEEEDEIIRFSDGD